eukprot:GHVU01119760.1.p1 GENE.GHVU01119760.1~~GHVU01119760.1.p1  ORF type:complete len:485 (-),score=79.00 GHVU01119760.1:1679-3085(-)
MRKQAAQEIEKALKQNGSYRIVFIVKEDSGRVRAQDATTMKLVLDALPKDAPFGIVVNQISPKVYEILESGKRDLAEDMGTDNAMNTKAFLTCLMSGVGLATSEVFFYPRMDVLEGKQDVVVEPAAGFRDFLDRLPSQVVNEKDVGSIITDDFDAVQEALESRIKELLDSKANLEAEFPKLKAKDPDRQLQGDGSGRIYTTSNIFVGNPGVGKSALLNGLIGSARFQCGLNFGSGLTKVLQLVEHQGVQYVDTPGLADVDMRKQAAQEIERALKQNCSYRIVFVVKEDDGRVRAQDATTMKLVLDALPEDVPFGIVVNQISPEVYKILQSGKRDLAVGVDTDNAMNMKAFLTCLMSGVGRATKEVFFYPRMDVLEGKQDVVVEPAAGFRDFLDNLPSKVVNEKDVSYINTDDFAAIKEALEGRIKELLASNVKIEAEFAKLNASFRNLQSERRVEVTRRTIWELCVVM